VIRDALLWKKSLADVWTVVRPKVRGALWLDEVTAGEPLDFLALFSSVAGLAGNVGQADYAYANAFLDAFARSREILAIQQLRHGRTISINWPLWQEGGMQLSAGLAAFKMPSLAPLDTATGFQIFETALRAGEPQVAGLILMESNLRELLLTGGTAHPLGIAEAMRSPDTGWKPSRETARTPTWQMPLACSSSAFHN
jgi:hypothetical protein